MKAKGVAKDFPFVCVGGSAGGLEVPAIKGGRGGKKADTPSTPRSGVLPELGKQVQANTKDGKGLAPFHLHLHKNVAKVLWFIGRSSTMPQMSLLKASGCGRFLRRILLFFQTDKS